jgi:hypothetical protein
VPRFADAFGRVAAVDDIAPPLECFHAANKL